MLVHGDVLTLTGELADKPIGPEHLKELASSQWPRWQKVVPTCAIKVAGPFKVATSEGELSCKDGYLAVDARGYPYPIATDEFQLIYEPKRDV